LGYTGCGGTLDLEGMLFVNRCTWAHCVYEVARLLDQPACRYLTQGEIDAIEGRMSPMGAIIHRSPSRRGPTKYLIRWIKSTRGCTGIPLAAKIVHEKLRRWRTAGLV